MKLTRTIAGLRYLLFPRTPHSALKRCIMALVLCLSWLSLVTESCADEEPPSKGHNQKIEDCPPGTRGPFSSCAEYWEAINKEALRLGYADSGGNGTADFLETYRVNDHDCADVAAEVACVSNQSECIEQVAKQYRSNSANHSDNYVEGIGECDFTPMRTGSGHQANKGQAGGGLADNHDTTIDDGAPDPGENVDPAYTCAMNGANRRSAGGGAGGGMGSAASNMAMMMALSQLMNGMNGGMSSSGQDLGGSDQSSSSNSGQNTLPTPPPTPQGTIPTGLPTPPGTPTPTPRPALAPREAGRAPMDYDSRSKESFSEESFFESNSNTAPPSRAKVPPLDSGFFAESNEQRKKAVSNQAWDDVNRDMFEPRDIE